MIIHATTVDHQGCGILLKGASGSGKSGLALQLMALGCCLVADDKTILKRSPSGLAAHAPTEIKGMIEARGVGLLNAESRHETNLRLIVDMDHLEKQRFPPGRTETLLGVSLTCLRKVDAPYFPAAVMQYVQYGRQEPG